MWVIPFYPCMLPATVVSQSSSSGANATELWFREKNVFIHMCSHSHSVNYNSTAKSTFKISLNLSLHLIIAAVRNSCCQHFSAGQDYAIAKIFKLASTLRSRACSLWPICRHRPREG